MKAFWVELGGKFGDVIWRKLDAESISAVRRICARKLPTYRVLSVKEQAKLTEKADV